MCGFAVTFFNLHPEGQIVAVVVGVIGKTTEVGEDAESELRELLKDLSDEEGFVRVEDLKRLSLEMLRAEAAEEEEMGEDGGGGGEDSMVKSTSKM